MGRSSRRKEKYEKSGELSQDHCNAGTAARTRPFSFDEIMLRRKNKELSENVKEGAVEAENKSGDGVVENVSDRYESEKDYRHKKDSSPGVKKYLSEEFVKESARKKEENDSAKDDRRKKQENNSTKDDRRKKEENYSTKDGRRKKEENNSTKDDRRKKEENNSTKDDRRKKEENDSTRDDKLAKRKDRESRESEIKFMKKDMSSKDKGKTEKQIHGRKKFNGQPSDDSENEAANKHSRDITGKDRHADRGGGRSERESKRKYQNGDDEKNQGRSATRKHDLGKGSDLEISERKESSRSHHGLKRRRSRSREREGGNTRSISLSPRTHKRTSHHGLERGELASHSLKSRSVRDHSDIDRKRITSNGSSSSSHYRRLGGYKSGLGGYSPRKRKTEAAAKTPSPTNRSPEKKSAKWDVAPSRTDRIFSGSLSNFQSSNQTGSSNVHEVVSTVPVASTTMKPLTGVSSSTLSTKQNVSIDSVQLTQATRPIRRLYVENVPASASENALMECLNDLLLSLGISHIQGIHPCISCIIHKEKGQALVEFLTPEYASAALYFDGSSFSGSTLKIRRPKDFVEVATGEPEKSEAGEPEKSEAAVDAISDIMKDSPHKIFIGGISKALSSEMLMEIASAFGSLKAYHFEVNRDLHEPCAFLEYVDQSVTVKACAGLNGMKLGGQVITAFQAVPNASSLENIGNPLFYGIHDHARPLLKKPTQVLKLKNVLNPVGLSSLSELEVEEALEDVRVECTRFGTVKSINVVKYSDSHIPSSEAREVNGSMGAAGVRQSLGSDETNDNPDTLEEVVEHYSGGINGVEFPGVAEEVKEVDKIVEGNSIDDKPVGDLKEDELRQPGQLDGSMTVEDQACESISETVIQEFPHQLNTSKDESDCLDDKVADKIHIKGVNVENKLTAEEELNTEEGNGKLRVASVGSDGSAGIESDNIERGDNKEQDCNLKHIFEPGSVFVEYGRTEASCMAAHCLHGRLFDDRTVTVEYVALDLYRAKFPK